MQSRCYPVQLMSGLEVMPLTVVIRTMCLLVVKRTLKTFPWQTRYYIISNLLLHTTALYEFPKMSVGAYVLGWVVKPGTELQVHWISTKNGKKNDTSFGMTSINSHQAPPKATLTWKSYVHSCVRCSYNFGSRHVLLSCKRWKVGWGPGNEAIRCRGIP